MEIFVIKDEKVGFLNITVESLRDLAVLKFGMSFAAQDVLIGRCEDYSLYAVGKFDIIEGIHMYDSPQFITNGLSAYNRYCDSIIKNKRLDIETQCSKECDSCGTLCNSTKENGC